MKWPGFANNSVLSTTISTMMPRPHDAPVALSFLLVLVTATLYGQERSSPEPVSEVMCVVTDAVTGAVVPQSTVVFKSESGEIVGHTSMDGSVREELRTGKYIVTASQRGFATSKPVTLLIDAPASFKCRVVLELGSGTVHSFDTVLPGVPTLTSDLPSVIAPPSTYNVQEPPPNRDCATNHFMTHKTPCLCGKIQLSSGDIGVSPANMGLDDRVDVELRDSNGRVLESKQLTYKSEVPFCFSGKRKGRYAVAFIRYDSGKPQPATVFPTNYTAKPNKKCNVIYLVPPACSE